MQPIFTQTASGSSATISFNNIPQTFTDLQLLVSARSEIGTPDNVVVLQFNLDSTSALYSDTRVYGTGASTASDRATSTSYMRPAHAMGAGSTANTATNCEIYIPNYTNAIFKSVESNYVTEQNAASTATFQVMVAGLWRNTAAITSLQLKTLDGQNFTNISTFTLYGITKG